jgi:tetratricopeptide (TPR) repeat protein
MVLAEAAESKVETRDVEACFANLELDWEGYRRLQRVAVSGEGNRKLFEQLTDVIRDEDLKGATKKGACLYVLGKITEARAALERAHPQSEMASVLLGQLHEDAERWSEAKATYKAALDTNKASKRALFGLIKSSLMLAETDEAASLLANAGKAHDGDAEFLYVKAFAAELSGEYHEASELFEKVIKLDPNHARALFRLGRYHTTWGNIEKAVDYYERCCSQTPTYGNALINLGVLYEDLNRWEEACRCYQLVLKGRPGSPASHDVPQRCRSLEEHVLRRRSRASQRPPGRRPRHPRLRLRTLRSQPQLP